MTKEEKLLKEQARLKMITTYENEAYDNGYSFIGGVDEVGRGCLFGEVVSCMVVLPKGLVIEGINDSKKLSEKKRELLNTIILEKALSVTYGIISPEIIDDINIKQATLKAMEQCVLDSKCEVDFLLIDAEKLTNIEIPQLSLVKGDEKSVSIGAASICAKVFRDNLMKKYDEIYPEYDLKNNKGYGTKKHTDAIKRFGATKLHRQSFLKNILKDEN